MAWDPELEALVRGDLGGRDGIAERRMFGGLAFMAGGHMICGLHRGGVFVRLGRGAEAALSLPGVAPMRMGGHGRPMAGIVALSDRAARDDALRGRLIGEAAAFAATLPPKPPAGPRRRAARGQAPKSPL